jgi:hypothetical protein
VGGKPSRTARERFARVNGIGGGDWGGWVAALFCPQACRKTTRLRLAAAKSLRRA